MFGRVRHSSVGEERHASDSARRHAFLHTSPLDQPGGGDAGGMNVYVRALALELAATGVAVDIYTRRTSPDQPETVALDSLVSVHHIVAGPFGKVSKEALPS